MFVAMAPPPLRRPSAPSRRFLRPRRARSRRFDPNELVAPPLSPPHPLPLPPVAQAHSSCGGCRGLRPGGTFSASGRRRGLTCLCRQRSRFLYCEGGGGMTVEVVFRRRSGGWVASVEDGDCVVANRPTREGESVDVPRAFVVEVWGGGVDSNGQRLLGPRGLSSSVSDRRM
jgi:hypothetical protein